MTTVLLVRHGLTATTGHVLTGWMPGIPLDDRGRAQSAALAARLAPLRLDAIISSPLERCLQTAAAIADGRDGQQVIADDRVGECRYGDWTGRPLKKLATERLWRVVQAHPSAVTFPGPDGESMPDMQHRAVAAVRDWNARLGQHATYLICSHGDVIKAIVADSLGLHLDQCQRIQADPCSLTVIRYTPLRPFLVRMNDRGGGVDDLMPRAERHGANGAASVRDSDAAIGGGSGGAVVTGDGPAGAPAGSGGVEPPRSRQQGGSPACQEKTGVGLTDAVNGAAAVPAGATPSNPAAPSVPSASSGRQQSADTRG
ncbi:MAG TPA: MSMEG_4193 family putative phosphomutase [Streptosporangiaceae bacterium]|nr:MSMEG_4193 family putative phosphomutase [Streptosporangiaceae bacterium]